jgi:hypothetical protein
MFKENRVFSYDLLSFVEHKRPKTTGVLEFWNIGEKPNLKLRLAATHHSNIPPFHSPILS